MPYPFAKLGKYNRISQTKLRIKHSLSYLKSTDYNAPYVTTTHLQMMMGSTKIPHARWTSWATTFPVYLELLHHWEHIACNPVIEISYIHSVQHNKSVTKQFLDIRRNILYNPTGWRDHHAAKRKYNQQQ